MNPILTLKNLISKNKTWLKNVFTIIVIFSAMFLVFRGVRIGHEKYSLYNETKKHSICPSLFSIARTSQDTLIVMKAESLCNDYLLENLD